MKKNIMLTVLAGLVLLGLALLMGAQTQVKTMPMQALQGNSNTVADPNDLQAIVPDGQEITFAELKKRAKDVAQLLTPLNPTHIRRDGNRFTLTTTPTTISKQGVTVYVSGKVTCEATKSGNVITLKKIDGVQVNAGVGGKLNLKEAVITPGANNTATVDGKLELSRWLPYIPFSVTVDTDKP